jgi:hypothetical protein
MHRPSLDAPGLQGGHKSESDQGKSTRIRILPAPPAPPDASREWHKQRLTWLYKQHNPIKIKDVDDLMAKYAGREEELFTRACQKYGIPYKNTVLNRGNRRVVATWYKPDVSDPAIKGFPEAIVGTYTENGTHHGAPVFVKDRNCGNLPVFLYFWSDDTTPKWHGWWIGSAFGRGVTWAQGGGDATKPPPIGWLAPAEGEARPEIEVLIIEPSGEGRSSTALASNALKQEVQSTREEAPNRTAPPLPIVEAERSDVPRAKIGEVAAVSSPVPPQSRAVDTNVDFILQPKTNGSHEEDPDDSDVSDGDGAKPTRRTSALGIGLKHLLATEPESAPAGDPVYTAERKRSPMWPFTLDDTGKLKQAKYNGGGHPMQFKNPSAPGKRFGLEDVRRVFQHLTRKHGIVVKEPIDYSTPGVIQANFAFRDTGNIQIYPRNLGTPKPTAAPQWATKRRAKRSAQSYRRACGFGTSTTAKPNRRS